MTNKKIIYFLATFFALEIQSQNWLPMNIDQDAKCFYVDTVDDVLYTGGYIFNFGNKTTFNGMAKWNGTFWDTLPNKLSGSVSSICRYKNKLYVTGNFNNTPYNCPRKTLMAWNFTTSNWESVGIGLLGNGIEQGAAKMKVLNNELYFYGGFDSIYNLKVNCIVKFDGTNWTSLNFPSVELIKDIELYNSELYAAGQFINLNGDPNMDFVVKYNGTNWINVGSDFSNASSIESMAVYKNELYISGYFLKSNGCPGNHITKFNGSSWQEVNGGFSYLNLPPAIVRNMQVFNDTMYINGSFDKMGTMPAKGLVMYDGIKFCAIDNSLFKYNGGPLAKFKSKLYLGCSWFAYGTNQDTVWYMAQQNKFTVDTCQAFAVGIEESNLLNTINELTVYPNPSNGNINIVFKDRELDTYSLEIYNVLGQMLYKKNLGKTFGHHTETVDVSHYSSGMYIVNLVSSKESVSLKIIKQ